MKDFIPEFFIGLKNYNFKMFLNDMAAGIIVAIVALPLSIALGIASGVTPEVGLITAVIGCFIVAILGGTKFQIAGPTGAFIVIVYSIIEQHGMLGLTIATMMAGVMLVVIGFLKGGEIIKFIPYPVVAGFTSGIAVTIFSSQIKDILGLGVEKIPAQFMEQILCYIQNIQTLNFYAILITIVSIFIIILWPKIPKFGKLIPSMLVSVIVLTLLVQFFTIPTETIGSRFGSLDLKITFVNFNGISFELIKSLLPASITIAVLAGIESLLSAVVADGMTNDRHNSNTELVGQGFANIASAAIGGIPVTGAIARTATNIKNGAKSPVSAMISSIALFIMVMVLLNFVNLIPMASLGAILLVISYNMGEWEYFKQIKKAPRSDYFVFIATFLLTVFFDLIIGISVGMIFALIIFMKRMSDLTNFEMITKDLKHADGNILEIPNGVLVYNINGPFFFGAAEKFSNMLLDIVKPKTKIIVVNLENVPLIDATGYRGLKIFYNNCKKK
ncbi:sulfate permease [Campylobacter ureolyticus ACS-301-V-Sch3b]|uniref:Sulfate permease n=2 Tax=Campylobacter ureolyticus TaxID=827 RepID=S3XIY3_9BACT|nr:SulP family inorganic anion transporter [Campylobacter ureolyticus]EPH09327.1 sulfate permease [Campylobacter ureolyticus ACS-301-V-Sch3b]